MFKRFFILSVALFLISSSLHCVSISQTVKTIKDTLSEVPGLFKKVSAYIPGAHTFTDAVDQAKNLPDDIRNFEHELDTLSGNLKVLETSMNKAIDASKEIEHGKQIMQKVDGLQAFSGQMLTAIETLESQLDGLLTSLQKLLSDSGDVLLAFGTIPEMGLVKTAGIKINSVSSNIGHIDDQVVNTFDKMSSLFTQISDVLELARMVIDEKGRA